MSANPFADLLEAEPSDTLRQSRPYPGTERFNLMSLTDLNRLPDLEWLVDGILPAGGLAMLHGHPEAGKSFLALDWALTVATGKPDWCGAAVRPGKVVYVGAEAVRSLKPRVAAWQARQGGTAPQIEFVGQAVQLMNRLHRLPFIQSMREANPDMVVVDTFAKCLAGGDDSSSKDVSAGMETLDRVRQETGAAVLFLHHNTKKSNDERGSGVFRADVDVAALFTAQNDGTRRLSCTKMRDAEQFDPLEFTLEPSGPSAVLVPAAGVRLSLRERLVQYVRTKGEANLTDIRAAMGGRAELVDEAIRVCVLESVLNEKSAGRARVFSVREKPRRTGTDG